MAKFLPFKKEIIISILVFVWFLFAATNINAQLGNTFANFTMGSIALLIIGITIFDKNLKITFQKAPGGHLKALAFGFGAYLVLLFISAFVMRFVDPALASVGSILIIMGATTPALAQSKVANWITFSLAVPFTETQLWARLQEFFADVFGININRASNKTVGMIFLIVVLAIVFVFFHLTSKGITSASTLVVVFIMMVMSLLMVNYFQETRQAFFLHCIANGIASYLIFFT